MNEIKCPKCGEIFSVDESGYAAIVKQVRDEEFSKEIEQYKENIGKEKETAVKLAVAEAESKSQKELSEKNSALIKLKGELEAQKAKSDLEVREAIQQKDAEILKLKSELTLAEKDKTLSENKLIESHKKEVELLNDEIKSIKDFKERQSTKMVGESLERHCETEFNRLRATAFPNAYFEKDNDARTGSKGDYIFKEKSADGVEFISIMFEMKNEMDTTTTKHKNEDFFKELDKDRREKGCEYAVLVSLLERDNELYNDGIVDVSYRYEKMYVIRPQFFIPIITILRNAALNSLEYRTELMNVRNQNIDITHFEDAILDFKDKFSRNYRLASEKFQTAIAEIDKSIDHLNKIKSALISSENNLRLANNKAEDLTIKRLTKNNPTMSQMFDDLNNAPSDE